MKDVRKSQHTFLFEVPFYFNHHYHWGNSPTTGRNIICICGGIVGTLDDAGLLAYHLVFDQALNS